MYYLELLTICCILVPCPAKVVKDFYEEVSESNGNIITDRSTNLKSFPHKPFHQCSLRDACHYVVNDTVQGKFIIYNTEHELPLERRGLKIWKKLPQVEAFQHAHEQHGGWIVFQRRVDATVNFYRSWGDYKQGFGDLNGNFWLGLEKLHQLAAPGRGATLRVDLKHMDFPGVIKYAEYSLFEIGDESDGYRMMVGGYHGDAGDALSYHNNRKFTTYDRDNDAAPSKNCAMTSRGAWWYGSCFYSNLNAMFPRDKRNEATLMSWACCSKPYGGLSFTEMKVNEMK